ncbi:nitroreductase [Neokomagataea sp. TBRC 2177]|uniref:Putative NAD(P)H nitroreductase n=2 Tax=Neokomagataea anthophila TaxID=2826925 RepID=A0ABS5E7B9_9PROT|nr:nitroreductase [Neokomagataea anthophila]
MQSFLLAECSVRSISLCMSQSVLDVLLSRASTDQLVEPAPAGDQLARILSAGLRAPDHGKLRPWRYTVITGEHRETFSEQFHDALLRQSPDMPEANRLKRRERMRTMPAIIALGFHVQPDAKIPVSEQEMALAAGAMNVLNALYVEGFGGVWVTGAFQKDRALLESLGLPAPHRLEGLLLVGTPSGPVPAKRRPDIESYMALWQGKSVSFAADKG